MGALSQVEESVVKRKTPHILDAGEQEIRVTVEAISFRYRARKLHTMSTMHTMFTRLKGSACPHCLNLRSSSYDSLI